MVSFFSVDFFEDENVGVGALLVEGKVGVGALFGAGKVGGALFVEGKVGVGALFEPGIGGKVGVGALFVALVSLFGASVDATLAFLGFESSEASSYSISYSIICSFKFKLNFKFYLPRDCCARK